MHEYFERYGKVYMIMEFCYGGNLASRLPYSEVEAVRMVSTILSSVKAVHNSGMVHGSSK
jgi:serine/threonine protein kinase